MDTTVKTPVRVTVLCGCGGQPLASLWVNPSLIARQATFSPFVFMCVCVSQTLTRYYRVEWLVQSHITSKSEAQNCKPKVVFFSLHQDYLYVAGILLLTKEEKLRVMVNFICHLDLALVFG